MQQAGVQCNRGKPSHVRLERDGGDANHEGRIVCSLSGRADTSHARRGASILVQIRPLVQAVTLVKVFSPISHLSAVKTDTIQQERDKNPENGEHLHKMRLERVSATVFG